MSAAARARRGYQSNRNEQKQIQIVPIAPQLNVQNVNVLTFGDVEQGNANNANTGQANQQENTSRSSSSSCGAARRAAVRATGTSRVRSRSFRSRRS